MLERSTIWLADGDRLHYCLRFFDHTKLTNFTCSWVRAIFLFLLSILGREFQVTKYEIYVHLTFKVSLFLMEIF